MITQFDKIYVISLITNKDRQEFVTYQMNELGLDFEFIYGTDFNNIKYNYKNDDINYPKLFDNDPHYIGTFGCAISHYNAVLQAYHLGYNNVLILEDDICFIKDKQLIEDYLNNIPSDADFITCDPRFLKEEDQKNVINKLNNYNEKWMLLNNNINSLSCALIYGIMNRQTMLTYLNSQRSLLNPADSINNIFRKPKVIRYIPTKCICTDQYNIFYDINKIKTFCFYENSYIKIKLINNDCFYNPNTFSLFTRN